MSRPKLVGITGGIGSGKSTVCKIFEVLGVKVYYADDQAKDLMETNAEVMDGIKSIFGNDAYIRNKLNRAHIAQMAFGNKNLLMELNKVVHPAVRNDFENWVAEYSEEKMVLKEAALLIEAGSYKELDTLLLVVADEETRITRVINRDLQRTEDQVRKIISEQLPDAEKLPLASFVIDNNGDKSLIKQVTKIHSQLIIA